MSFRSFFMPGTEIVPQSPEKNVGTHKKNALSGFPVNA